MPEMICTRCKETFEYDNGDLRPYVYHKCPDGIFMGHKNPNLKKQKTYYTPSTIKHHKTKWQNFNTL